MSADRTREVMTRYLESGHTDISMMADDVIFTHMATGEEHHGPESVRGMLNHIYHVAFDARAETRNTIFTSNSAVFEADFVGKHIGEFAGMQATQKDVRVPLCVVYDLEDARIKRARVYFEMPVMFEQLGASS